MIDILEKASIPGSKTGTTIFNIPDGWWIVVSPWDQCEPR
jgi:hypothetical protein